MVEVQLPTESGVASLTVASAVNAALDRALAEFPEALLFGEDIALPGGVFGCTKGLAERYGERVFDTPISESAILGAALGAALMGRRPIVEIMWVDFTLVAFDQIVNQAANVRYVSNGRLHAPMTIRTQQGAMPGSCAQHSQSLEALFTHIPGLRVAMPSGPQEAYSLLLSAIASEDPAVVIEHRGMYPVSGDVRLGDPIEPVGGARVVRMGTSLTIVALGPMVRVALDAATTLATEGIDAEVIDPRWLAPFDTATVVASVSRTGRLVVAHQANITSGFGAEVAARIAHEAFWSLEAPIERVGLPDTRMPAAPNLQAALLPTAADIVAAARRVVAP